MSPFRASRPQEVVAAVAYGLTALTRGLVTGTYDKPPFAERLAWIEMLFPDPYWTQATKTSPFGAIAGQAPWTAPPELRVSGLHHVAPPSVEREARMGMPLVPKSVQTR